MCVCLGVGSWLGHWSPGKLPGSTRLRGRGKPSSGSAVSTCPCPSYMPTRLLELSHAQLQMEQMRHQGLTKVKQQVVLLEEGVIHKAITRWAFQGGGGESRGSPTSRWIWEGPGAKASLFPIVCFPH